jgi:hypothetical protein
MDSWGSGPGSTGGYNDPNKGVAVRLLSTSRKSKLSRFHCQGMLLCEFFDENETDIDKDYIRHEANEEEWAKIERLERERRQNLEQDPLYRTAL